VARTALVTGATGLLSFPRALDVVGNNLAILNTTDYKSQRTLFKDIFYQTLNHGSAPA
jgi:flagellar hook protein FlgE